MTNKTTRSLHRIILTSIIALASNFAHSTCQETGIQLQILGSGGPGDSMGRASSAYVLWINGESKLLIDAGSGSKNNFHLSGASMEQIELIALSHLHPDHSAELPAILWPTGGEFDLAGPSGMSVFPSIERFNNGLFGPNGIYEVLQNRLDIGVIEVDASSESQVWRQDGIHVTGMGVPHGNVPTIGYRVEVGDTSVAFTSDQNGSNPNFIGFIRDVDTLVIHMAANEDVEGYIAALHATPTVWGQMAQSANAGQVVVSHISTSDPAQLETNLGILREHYQGPIVVSEDLMCVELE